jgi:hypothetical protein
MGGKWYVLVIVDDYSRYSWVIFLKNKDEVFEHFWSLVLRLNNEYPNCLKAICSENGTEFRNASFNEFCLEHGVISSSLPSVSLNRMELWNKRTGPLVEMARMMLDEHRTPKRFWANVISTVCYISN